MTVPIDPATRERVVKLAGMLGSGFLGERAAAAAKLDAYRLSLGLTWDDLIVGRGPPRLEPDRNVSSRVAAMAACAQNQALQTEWEVRFLTSIRRRRTLTERQMATLLKIAAELPGRGRP